MCVACKSDLDKLHPGQAPRIMGFAISGVDWATARREIRASDDFGGDL